MRLMIVDDHAGVRSMIRHLVAEPGDTVCECASGNEAVRVAPVFQPDGVTMDIRMPGMYGFEALRSIRGACPSARIVIVTSYNEPFLRRAAAEAGAVGFFIKEDMTALRSVLRGIRRTEVEAQSTLSNDLTTVRERLSSGDPATNRPDAGTNPVDASQPAAQSLLRILMVEDSANDCELICRRLAQCGYQPFVERVWREDAMRQALEQRQWDLVFTDHGLPGFSCFAALGLMRRMGSTIPVICVTGSLDPNVIGQVLEAGAHQCVSKDDLSTLCAVIDELLGAGSDRPPKTGSEDTSKIQSNPAPNAGPASPQ
jgi:CheY-like chemotaxis protein